MSAMMVRRLQALSIAKRCVDLGARLSTIEQLSGLPQPEFRHLAYPTRSTVPRGRTPSSVDWLHRRTTVLEQAAAAVVMSSYRRLREGGFPASEALLGAYSHYTEVCDPPYRINLDRALDLASHLDGIWLSRGRSLELIRCPACGSEHLATLGSETRFGSDCPFCALIQRYRVDPRLRAHFPARPPLAASDFQIGVMSLMRSSPLHLQPEAHDEPSLPVAICA
ncbi:FlhC family transcriptional regulator [Piscinibacter sakaiensis]|uniref:FlhC family transcriptional regulator n=1 Tax=Piscinibacter sakaiensis TaxID=1547922 RepID=UPI003AB023C5